VKRIDRSSALSIWDQKVPRRAKQVKRVVVTALLDRLLDHAHVLTCGPRSWRTRLQGERAGSGA
jgi:hypothetical protein